MRSNSTLTIALALIISAFNSHAVETSSEEPVIVPTFECMSIYWNPSNAASEKKCSVEYKKTGESEWKKGKNLEYTTALASQYRGSIVNLEPSTAYEIRLTSGSATKTVSASTWNDNLPISKVVKLQSSSSMLQITESGTPDGYILYDGTGATVEVGGNADNAVKITASHVILKGLTIKGGQTHGIRIEQTETGQHTYGNCPIVVVEECDISDWAYQYGYMHAGVFVENNAWSTVIQGNYIHHPKNGSNYWYDYPGDGRAHPNGSHGIQIRTWSGTKHHSNQVIRFNELEASKEKPFNDGIGEGGNSSEHGCPGPDSDIYSNIIRFVADDGLEMEGSGMNVRIFKNYTDMCCFSHIATAPVSVGPMYIFCNILNRGLKDGSSSSPRMYAKTGYAEYAKGMQFWYHNSFLQTGSYSGMTAVQGVDGGITNVEFRNNILNSRNNTVDSRGGSNASFDYDMYNHNSSESHGIQATAEYREGHGPESDGNPKGLYQLKKGSKGYDKGAVIPNFSDGYEGAAPDIGAHEYDTPAMKFGREAWTAYKQEQSIDRSGANVTAETYRTAKAITRKEQPNLVVRALPGTESGAVYTIAGKRIPPGQHARYARRMPLGVYIKKPAQN